MPQTPHLGTAAFPEFSVSFTSKFDYLTTVATIKDAILAADMLVLHEINTQGILMKSGVKFQGFINSFISIRAS